MGTLAGVQANLTVNSVGFQQGITRATQSLNAFAASGAQANRQLQSQFAQTAASARQLRGITQQLGFQLQDIVVQLQAGQNAAIIFAQQGSQIAAVFGPMGAIIGVAVAVVGGLASAFLGLRDAAKVATDAQEALDRLMLKQTDTIEKLAEKYLGLNEAQRLNALLSAQKDVRDRTAELEAQQKAAAALGEELAQLARPRRSSTLLPQELAKPFVAVDDEQRALIVQVTEDLKAQRVVAASTAAEFQALAQAIGDPQLQDLADKMLANSARTEELKSAVDLAEKAVGVFSDTSGQAAKELSKLTIQAEHLARELGRVANIQMADIELGAANLHVVEAKKEMEAFEKNLKDQAAARERAAKKAEQDAQRQAERDKQFQINKAQELATALERISDQFLSRARARREAESDFTQDLRDQLSLQGLLLTGLTTESEAYRVHVALLEAKRRLGGELSADQEKMLTLLQQQATIIDANTEADREAQRLADERARLMARPFETAAENIQNAFTSAFENIYSGGVDTFSDLAAEVKRIFIRLAAEITTLMLFRGVTGAGGMAGLFGAAAAAGGIPLAPGFTTPGGVPVQTGFAQAGVLGTGVSGLGLLGAGAFGAIGGGLLGGQFGGQGQLGGTLGGGAGAIGGAILGNILFPGLGGIIGGAAGGGLLGGLGGGFLGSLFGGGSSGNEVSIGGGFGRAGAGGTGAAAKFVVEFDKKMSELLNERQLELADQALREAKSVSVKYDKELSEGDMARLAAGRVGPVAGALGFREKAFEGLGADAAIGQLQEALQLEKIIEDLTGAVTPFKRAILDLRESFAETEARAKELGISTTGMGKALRDAEKELRDKRDFERSSLRLQLQTIIGTGSASKELAVAIAGIKLQFQGLREQAEALGLSLKLVDQAEAAAIQHAREASRQLEAQRQVDRAGLQLQLRSMLGTGNASRQLALAIAQINLQFLALAESAKELGVSLELVEEARQETIRQTRAAHREAEREAKRQREADKAAAVSFIRDFRGGSGSDYARQIDQVNTAYRQALRLADQYNISERGLSDARREAIREIKRERDAERDAARAQRAADKASAKTFIADFIGAGGSDFERERAAINASFRQALRLADQYNISDSEIRKARTEQIRDLKRQQAAEKASAQAMISGLISGSDFERDLAAINATFNEAASVARQYGLSEDGLTEARLEAIRVLKQQQEEQLDALALSVIEPFLALSNPLRDFTEDLERSLLSPIALFRVAQEDFRETARLAQGGDTDAIQRLREEGEFYIQQASRFGASPEQVSATQEVLRATEGVTTQVDISMREASRGITDEIRKASRDEVDTLKELIAEVGEVAREIKRLRS